MDKDTLNDPIQQSIGQIGRWQIFVCGVMFLLKFSVAWHQLAIIFLAPKTEFTCKDESLQKCDPNCLEYDHDTQTFTNTIQMEWDIVCEKASLVSLSQTVFMLGILIGSIVFGILADIFGRRKPLIVAVVLQLVFGVAASFAPNYLLFVFLRFMTATATGGTMTTSFVLIMELIGARWRELVSVFYHIPFNLGHLSLALFGYLFRDWRIFQFAISIPSIFLLSYYWLVPESPRWLLTVGNTEKSVKILTRAAKWNKMPTESIRANIEEAYANKTEKQAKGSMLDLFRTKNLLKHTLCMNFNWFVFGACFFGASQYVSESGGNIFKNVAWSAAFEFPGTFLCVLLLKTIGRKKTLILANCVGGLAMLGIAFIDQHNVDLKVALSTIAITGMSINFPTIYLYAGELFPTVIRNSAIGLATGVARIGSMLAPFIATGFPSNLYWLPPLILGIIPLIGASLTLLLPETLGCKLPETIEDGENFGKKIVAAADSPK